MYDSKVSANFKYIFKHLCAVTVIKIKILCSYDGSKHDFTCMMLIGLLLFVLIFK